MSGYLGTALALVIAFIAGAANAQSVGYQGVQMPDPMGASVEVGVWYPTSADPKPMTVQLYEQSVAEGAPLEGAHLPLIVMSHGNGGGFAGHYDTAMALARAGYVVAALTHTGDNYRDQSAAVQLPNRPRQLKLLVDYMLNAWSGRASINPNRIGAFGFSAGGFTVLALAGGEPDLSTVRPHCAAHPGYYDCLLLARFSGAAASIQTTHPDWAHDQRIKAVVVAAPAVGFAFGRTGLSGVGVPVQLWAAQQDRVLPVQDYASAVRRDLPKAPDYRLVAGADHYDFLAPCTPALEQVAKTICVCPAGFDRAGFHQTFNRDVVAFFDRALKP